MHSIHSHSYIQFYPPAVKFVSSHCVNSLSAESYINVNESDASVFSDQCTMKFYLNTHTRKKNPFNSLNTYITLNLNVINQMIL